MIIEDLYSERSNIESSALVPGGTSYGNQLAVSAPGGAIIFMCSAKIGM